MKKININDDLFGERLLKLISVRFKTQSEFAERIGKPVQSVSRIIKTDKASLEFINEIVEIVPDLNLNWLLRGLGEMFVTQNSPLDIKKKIDEEFLEVPNSIIDLLLSQQRTIENLSEAVKKNGAHGGNAKCAAAG